jgi:hypothetical protein
LTTVIVQYADDTSYIIPIFKSDGQDQFQLENSHLETWCKQKGLLLNNSKTQILYIPKKRIPKSIANPLDNCNIKLLGVIFNAQQSWKAHFTYITSICSKRLHILRRLKSTLAKKDLIIVYKAIIGSLMNYCAPLFLNSGTDNDNLLKVVENRAHKIICGKYCKSECIPKIESTRITQSLKLFNKIKLDPSHLLHSLLPTKSSKTDRFILNHYHSIPF